MTGAPSLVEVMTGRMRPRDRRFHAAFAELCSQLGLSCRLHPVTRRQRLLMQAMIETQPKLQLLTAALPEGYRVSETGTGDYLIEGSIDPQVLATVTAWCARLDVLATNMRVEQRSLEDVFLDLTGRELR